MLTGCFKDDCKTVEQIYKPVYTTLKQFRETQIKTEAAKPVNVSGKIYLYQHYIFHQSKTAASGKDAWCHLCAN